MGLSRVEHRRHSVGQNPLSHLSAVSISRPSTVIYPVLVLHGSFQKQVAIGGNLLKYFLLSSKITGVERKHAASPACSLGTGLNCDPAGLGLLSQPMAYFWPKWTLCSVLTAQGS